MRWRVEGRYARVVGVYRTGALGGLDAGVVGFVQEFSPCVGHERGVGFGRHALVDLVAVKLELRRA